MSAVTEPRISIIIPTFARPAKLRACLDAIAHLDFDRDAFETIVVDDGSPAPIDGILADFEDRLAVRVVRQQRAGPGPARNAGAHVARGRYLAFLDDDCAPAPDWLAVMVRELDRDDRQLLGGRVVNALPDNPYAVASDDITNFVYDYYRLGVARERFFTTGNIALAARFFHTLGGFTTAIPSATAEDKEFCDRWCARGLALTHVPAAVVYHTHDLTLRSFLRQHFNYGRGILSFRLLRRARAKGLLVPEPLRFYSDLVTSPLRQRGPHRWRAVALLTASQLATAAGALYEAAPAVARRLTGRNGRAGA